MFITRKLFYHLMNFNSSTKEAKPKLSIGLPVFNGEKFIRKRLDSIISQTFSDFIVLISDNCSTDNTQKICRDYLSKDSRIEYFRQEKNIGGFNNFSFLLDEAKSKYFVWAAVDDWWLPQFLEKNVKILESNNRFVGSISKIEYYDMHHVKTKSSEFSKIKKYYSYDEYPKSPDFENRVKFYLRLNRAENIYSIFHTDIIKKFRKIKQCAGLDLAIILGVLKYGEINIIDEVLMYRSAKGVSGIPNRNPLTMANEYGFLGKIFPFLPFSIWIAKNLGLKVLIQNLDYLLFINLSATKYQLKHGLK